MSVNRTPEMTWRDVSCGTHSNTTSMVPAGSMRPNFLDVDPVQSILDLVTFSSDNSRSKVLSLQQKSLWISCFSIKNIIQFFYELLMMQQVNLNAWLIRTMLGMVSTLNRTSPWLGAILWSWLVCKRPRSPIFVLQIMSSFPKYILVFLFREMQCFLWKLSISRIFTKV